MNSSIVIALPKKLTTQKKIRTILNRHGFSVAAVCSTASTALASMSELDGGILICGYKLTDRYYQDVLEDIPSYFEMLLLASGRVIAGSAYIRPYCGNANESQRLGKHGGYDVVPDRAAAAKKRRGNRKRVLGKSRITFPTQSFFLWSENHLSEEDAYRYIQKCSMDSGTNMVETAQMVLMLLYDEV